MDLRIKPSKLHFFDNRTLRLTAKQVREKTGADYVINCVAFDFDTFQPVMGFRMNGETIALDDDYYGIAWNDASDITMSRASAGHDNYMTFIPLVHDSAAMELYVGASGRGARTAFGVFDNGDIWLYAAKEPTLTPWQMQDLALLRGVEHAVLLDGSGSTSASSKDEEITVVRNIPIFRCVWGETINSFEEGETMFKIALGAGHGINTPGKRCMKTLDPNETREWWLNDRICDYIEDLLKDYEGYKLLRLDDSDDGADNIALEERVKAANDFDADVYVSVHHNAGANGTNAGGIVAYSYPNSAKGAQLRDELYDALIDYTGLKGNRAEPTQAGNFYVLKHSAMPAVLLELGFMDSKVDVPIILSNAYAKKCAKAITEVLVKRGGLTKKAVTEDDGVLYKVQLGAFSKKENAQKLQAQLKAEGHQAYIVKA